MERDETDIDDLADSPTRWASRSCCRRTRRTAHARLPMDRAIAPIARRRLLWAITAPALTGFAALARSWPSPRSSMRGGRATDERKGAGGAAERLAALRASIAAQTSASAPGVAAGRAGATDPVDGRPLDWRDGDPGHSCSAAARRAASAGRRHARRRRRPRAARRRRTPRRRAGAGTRSGGIGVVGPVALHARQPRAARAGRASLPPRGRRHRGGRRPPMGLGDPAAAPARPVRRSLSTRPSASTTASRAWRRATRS